MDMELQYEMVVSSRQALFDFCKCIQSNDFIVENSNFGRGSIRNLLVHIGNTYEFWIGKQSLKKEILFTEYYNVKSVDEMENYFENVDDLVKEFLSTFAHDYLSEINVTIQDKTFKASPLKLFTHVITHEFHHKGQILSLSRHLGYTPVDTDIIR